MLRGQFEIQFRIYIYTRTPQIEYSRHKKLRVFYIFEFADVAVSYIYIYIYAKSTDRIFHWNIFGPGIFYLWISRIYIYIYETVINLIQKLKKHCIFCSWTILLSIYLFGIDFFAFIFHLQYLVFVLYVQNAFCKPLQISQIEYSDGLVPKKKTCLLFIHVSIDSCSQLFTFVYFFIRLFDYLFVFSLILHCLKVFYIFPSLNFLYLFSIYSSSLFPVYSFF